MTNSFGSMSRSSSGFNFRKISKSLHSYIACWGDTWARDSFSWWCRGHVMCVSGAELRSSTAHFSFRTLGGGRRRKIRPLAEKVGFFFFFFFPFPISISLRLCKRIEDSWSTFFVERATIMESYNQNHLCIWLTWEVYLFIYFIFNKM